jgi:hypothetical protein
MAAAELDSDFEDDLLEPEPEVPSKKQATAGGSKSTKKIESLPSSRKRPSIRICSLGLNEQLPKHLMYLEPHPQRR